MTIEEIKKVSAEFNEMDAEQQYKWLVSTELKPHFYLFLDNDSTSLYFDADTEADFGCSFKDDLGNRSGVDLLLDALGIRYEGA